MIQHGSNGKAVFIANTVATTVPYFKKQNAHVYCRGKLCVKKKMWQMRYLLTQRILCNRLSSQVTRAQTDRFV